MWLVSQGGSRDYTSLQRYLAHSVNVCIYTSVEEEENGLKQSEVYQEIGF
jgi:hypothetical protein